MSGGMGPRLCAPLLLNCTSWRSGWTSMREGRRRRLHRQERPEAVMSRADCLRHDAVGVRADGGWLSSRDDSGLSASATAGDEYGCES